MRMHRVPEQSLNFLVRKISYDNLKSCFSIVYFKLFNKCNVIPVGRNIYKGERLQCQARNKQFVGPSSHPPKFKPKPRLQDSTESAKELPQQKSTTSGEYSFDLELGASASKVYQRQKELSESAKQRNCLQKLTKGKPLG